MKQIERLRSLIKESIQEYIKEIDEAAETAAMEARIAKCDEAISARETRLENLRNLEEAADMLDEAKVKAMENEIKELKKAKAKFEKAKEKRTAKLAGKGKKEVTTDAKTEDAPVDESDVMEKMEVEGDMPKEEALNESFLKMQKLAGVITEAQYNSKKKALVENQLNEDILELKQMSKQLYSFLKKKGFPVTLENKLRQPINPLNPKGGTITTNKSQVTSDINVEPVQIIVTEGNKEMVTVAISPSNVARILVGKGDDWGKWQKNPDIVNYVNKLGNELLAEIKGKYPNMVYKFEQQEFIYLLHFGYGQTKKGGQLNPNDSKNKPAE